MRATVVFNRSLSPAYLHLGIAAPNSPGTFRAGEFVMVRPAWIGDPFLPRAFSIYRISTRPPAAETSTPIVEILYKVLGKGTQCLARMEPGQEVEILGPLGNSFTVPDDLEQAVLVAGGIGVPPIAALACQMRNTQGGLECGMRNIEVFLGGKTHEDILCVKDFEEAGAGVHITTEDASLGTRGLITDLLRPFLLMPSASPLTIYTCGPPGMLAAVAKLAGEFGVPCQVSVEANMACGFGACMGCAIEVKGEARSFKLVCKDGPIFDSREIVW
ncbi:MAG TPA: dihydroorotate dehydrogenase electron transfer subunit [Candidatus Methylomirabilis sp.]|nr:dihydroorotate dehydrogenase electron transfer subunit [Candidatus Methylomirabilis sp.]